MSGHFSEAIETGHPWHIVIDQDNIGTCFFHGAVMVVEGRTLLDIFIGPNLVSELDQVHLEGFPDTFFVVDNDDAEYGRAQSFPLL